MATYLLDTNIVDCLLKKQQDTITIKEKLQDVLKQNAIILISPVVFYELARLLYQRKAQRQLDFLEKLSRKFHWCELSKTTWQTGAKLWATCRAQGKPTGEGFDADVLIAAQAQERDAIVITKNTRHFQYLGIGCESW